MKGIFSATWEFNNKVSFELADVQELAGMFIPVKGTSRNHSVSITEEIEANNDTEKVLDIIKEYAKEKNIELANQSFSRGFKIK